MMGHPKSGKSIPAHAALTIALTRWFDYFKGVKLLMLRCDVFRVCDVNP